MAKSDQETTCSWVQEYLEAYVDGELPSDKSARMDAHLAACADCETTLECARDVKATLASLPQLDCPDDVVDRALRQIDTEDTARPLVKRSWWPGRLNPGWYLAAAAAVAVLVVGGLLAHDAMAPPVHIAQDVTDVPSQPREAPEIAVPPTPTQEELALAEQQVKATLIYVSGIGQRGAIMVTDGLLRSAIHSPLGDAVTSLVEKAGALAESAKT